MGTPWFMYPVTKGFTGYTQSSHDGWDFGAPSRTPLISLTGGVVTGHTGWYPWGGEIDTKNPTGVTETFAHAKAITVRPGQVVLPGQQVGLSGGENLPAKYSSGPHIHYSLFGGAPWDNTKAINPGPFLSNARSAPGKYGVGSAADSAQIDAPQDIPGVAAIATAIDNAYKGAEAAVANTVKRIGWFLLGLLVIAIGVFLLYTQAAGAIERRARPYAEAAAKVL